MLYYRHYHCQHSNRTKPRKTRKKKTLEKEEEPAEVAKREESSKVNDNIPGRRGVDQKDLAAVQNVIKGQIKAEEDHAYYMAHTIGSYYDASTGKLVKQEKPTEEKRRKRVFGFLLSLSKRIEPVDLATYSIKSCIKEALDEYSFKGNERKRAKVRKTNELNDLQFKGSKHFVKHILFNLLKNALDYAGEKAMITIWAGINRAGRYQVIFKDDGEGMGRKKAQDIFKVDDIEPDEDSSNIEEGTGIGPAILPNDHGENGGSH